MKWQFDDNCALYIIWLFLPPTSEDELRTLSNKAQQLKRDISREHKRHTKEQGKASESSPAKSRREERLRKKLAEIEARIVLAAPDLALRIYHMQGKVCSLLSRHCDVIMFVQL